MKIKKAPCYSEHCVSIFDERKSNVKLVCVPPKQQSWLFKGWQWWCVSSCNCLVLQNDIKKPKVFWKINQKTKGFLTQKKVCLDFVQTHKYRLEKFQAVACVWCHVWYRHLPKSYFLSWFCYAKVMCTLKNYIFLSLYSDTEKLFLSLLCPATGVNFHVILHL